ncbi:MAG: hypothetical protein LBG61_05835 [Burkholderiales bacterium]|nr:hypothetical protein [Burkholderiales bacterium]
MNTKLTLSELYNIFENNLLFILSEIEDQDEVGNTFSSEMLSFSEEKENIREFIEDTGEYGIAYEALVAILETHPFRISSTAAIKLLEVGLLMRYKTESPEDALFDTRKEG